MNHPGEGGGGGGGSSGDNLRLLCSAAAAEAAGAPSALPRHRLVIRQQPERSRVGSISEKMDRRPIDPPPIVQLFVHDPADPFAQDFTVSPAYFMQVLLLDETGRHTMRHIKDQQVPAMAGSMVSPLHTLRDMSMAQGAYFVFSDLSVRSEGAFRLRFDLFEIAGDTIHSRASVTSDVFVVYSPKRFPGMMESTQLSRVFADQGLRIRIRTEAGTKKRSKKHADDAAAKRQRLSVGESVPPPVSMHCLPGISGIGGPAFASGAPLAAAAAAAARGPPPCSGGLGPSGLLIFPDDNKENIPPPDALGAMLGRGPERAPALRPFCPTSRPTRPETALDLDDIAAVALLDSLSSGAPGRSAAPMQQSAGTYARPPEYIPFAPRSSAFATSPMPPILQPGPPQRLSSAPGRLGGGGVGSGSSVLDRIPGLGIGAGIPLSNYRLSAVRAPGHHHAPPATAPYLPPPQQLHHHHQQHHQHHPHRPSLYSNVIDLCLDPPGELLPPFAPPHAWDAKGSGGGSNGSKPHPGEFGTAGAPRTSGEPSISLVLQTSSILSPPHPTYEPWNGTLPTIGTLPAISTQLAQQGRL
ncbi:hypothetical protein H4R18_002867 [Coemansia javaensis]|uniref:Velvet domain-containing protein n=1 Tax=Coemansia javaensis TaxID=2761396 RepID=A0A9W8HDU0_9FUNG|nr:hypothetical protein H4R18_002867 [Coemansia javaensis]